MTAPKCVPVLQIDAEYTQRDIGQLEAAVQ